MSLEPGSALGPYRVVAPLGAGGMGEVYRARDPRLGRDVAIKILPGAAAADPDRLRRFEQEARAIAALSHPNVVAIFDIGAGRLPYLVTELLEGETLRSMLERGPLGAERTVQFGLQIASGLAAAHARGIVHRDLKPENVFITNAGTVKILDFGLAKRDEPLLADDEITRTAETVPGTIMGTVDYMAPEQVRGQKVDTRTDIFACGAVLYEALTGRRAFRGETPADTLSAILSMPASALPFDDGTPAALAAIVRRCLEKAPDRRFQSAGALAAALESYSDVRTGAAVSVPPPVPASIAVLPFANLSAEPDNQYFSDGLAEDLVNALTRISGLRVASRTSSFRYRGPDADVRQIGRELGVGTILEGSVRRAGNRLRITAQLTDVADGYHIWSGRYDREIADVFDVQDEIVRAIVGAVAPALTQEAGAVVRRPTENLQAYDLYLRGRHFLNQRSPAVFAKAIEYFEQAIGLDPDYALAYAGLADCYSILRVYGWTPAEHSRPRALEAVNRALALDPQLPEAHVAKALYDFYFEPYWRAAWRHFEDALALNPRVGMVEAYYAMFRATEYRFEEARRRIARALELDAYSSLVHFLVATAYCTMADAEAAVRHAARALELQPDSLGPRWPQTVALAMAGRFAEALEAGEQVVARTRAPVYIGVLGMIYGRAGRLADARRLAQELDERQSRGEYVVPAAKLAVALGLDDRDAIRSSLAACAAGGAAPFSVVATTRWLLEEYRQDPEVDRLLDRLHDGARPGEGGSGGLRSANLR